MISLDTALKYSDAGFSIIPIRPDKKPFIPWTEFQKRHATREEIMAWFKKWPGAMIGIVTGEISGLCVVDCDNEKAYQRIQELLPDVFITCIAKTPRGYHLYFAYPKNQAINNAAGIIPGVDVRGEGGYIIAPPSINAEGKRYAWLPNLSVEEIKPASLPDAVITNILYSIKGIRENFQSDNNRQQSTTFDNIFCKGRRDEDLFHVANCLIKGGMQQEFAEQVLNILSLNCKPAFSLQDAQNKIRSALDRVERKERNLTQEIRELFLTTNDNITTTFVYQVTTCDNREEKKKALVILGRLVDEGFIQRVGNGVYRRIDSDCEDIDFVNAEDTALNIKWPFEIEHLVQIMPGNIIVIAGEPNAGKTAFLLNLVKLNMLMHKIFYFSSEMGGMELKKRLKRFDDVPLNSWKFYPKERSSNFADVIKPDHINIIDFLEVYDEFYKIGGMIREIYEKLNQGIAVIAIQKNKGTEYGLGGMRGLEKARLYLSMEPGRLKIVKAKNWIGYDNPNNKTRDFKLAQGCRFFFDKPWSR